MKPRVPLEREVQRCVVALLTSAGFRVWSLSQGYRLGGRGHGTTRQSKGLPDLWATRPGTALWVEVKRPGGEQTKEQLEFQADCAGAGVAYVVGGYAEVLTWLIVQRFWKLPPGFTIEDLLRVGE